MRAVYFFISLFVFLLGGGNEAGASVRHKPLHITVKHNITKKHPIKFVSKDRDSTIIEDTDLELQEEFFGTSVKETNHNKYFIEKHSMLHIQHAMLLYSINYFTKLKYFAAANSHSSPIYIVNRVLRI